MCAQFRDSGYELGNQKNQAQNIQRAARFDDYTILVRAQYDLDNRWPGYNCGNTVSFRINNRIEPLFSCSDVLTGAQLKYFKLKDNYNFCLTYFGQTIDYCK